MSYHPETKVCVCVCDFKNMSKRRKDHTNLTPAHLLRAAATLAVCLKRCVNGYVTGSNEWTFLLRWYHRLTAKPREPYVVRQSP